MNVQSSLKMWGCSDSNVSCLFPWKLKEIQRAQQHCVIEQGLGHKILFFNTVTTISYMFASYEQGPAHHSHNNLRQWNWSSGPVTTTETHHPEV